MNYWPLLGVLVVVVGFALRANPVAVVVIAGLTSGLAAGKPLPELLALIGESFLSQRTLALVFLTTSAVPFLYQTVVLLAIAYAIRFLAHAIAPLRATMGRFGTKMEDAGRTLGDGPVRVFARVTIPLLRPAILSGAALVFLAVVKELPMALILGPIGFETLATEIWSATSEGFYERAAGPATLLLVLSATTVAVLLREQDR